MLKKDDELGNKTAYKKKRKGKKKRVRKKFEIDSPKAEILVLGVGNLFSTYSHANWPKNGSKRRIWSKIRFFST